MLRPTLLAVLLAFAALPAAAQVLSAPGDPSPHSDAALVSGVASIEPGRPFEVALRLTMEEGWHSYWTNPGDSGMPTALTWALPAGWTAAELRFPFPERIDVGPLTSYGFSGSVFAFTTLTPPAGLPEGEVTLRGKATWLICEEVCLPAEGDVALTLPVRAGSPAPDPAWAAPLAEARRWLPVERPGWRVRAERTDDGYALGIAPPAGWTGDLSGAHFFADSAGVVQHNAEQTVGPDGDGFGLALVGSEFASEPVARLRGVLVAPEGRAWDDAGHRALAVDVPVGGVATAAAASASGVGEEAGLSLALALLLAFGGGLLLNLMPCVFPILSIKILGFAQGREGRGEELGRHGLMFAAGVLASFWALAAMLLAFRAAGAGLGWGFQLQSPALVAGLTILMFVLGLNLAGLFEVGFGIAGIGGRLDRKTGLGGAFLSGVLATVVASPCTAPFMGAALGYALARPPVLALAVFTALAVGMALPYVLLSYFPAWLKKLPRPGPWMVVLRQALAFPLFATAVWLLWVFGQQTGVDGLALLLFALVLAALACWLVGRWDRYRITRREHLVTRGLAAAAAGLALYVAALGARTGGPAGMALAAGAVSAEAAGSWQPYEPAAVEALVAEGRPVFVDFTAAWCLTCQVNKRVALHTDEVERAFRERGVTTVRADWTNRDATIAAALESFGRSGVPLYVLYPGDGAEPILLPEVLTPSLVLDALEGVAAAVAAR